MELIELYESMIKSIIKKYLGYAAKVGLDYDDLYQEASMAVLQAENTYKDNKDMKLETWIYNTVKWRIQRVLKQNSKHKDIISINSEIINQKNDTVSLLDLIADDTDYFQKVEDELMIYFYKDECQRVLEDDYEIANLRWFKGYSYEYIKKLTGINDVYGTLMKSRMKLIRKSTLYRQEYNKLHHINDFSEATRLVF